MRESSGGGSSSSSPGGFEPYSPRLQAVFNKASESLVNDVVSPLSAAIKSMMPPAGSPASERHALDFDMSQGDLEDSPAPPDFDSGCTQEQHVSWLIGKLGPRPPQKALATLLLASPEHARREAMAAAEEKAAEERARQASTDASLRAHAAAQAARLRDGAEEEASRFLAQAEEEGRRLTEQAQAVGGALVAAVSEAGACVVAEEEATRLIDVAHDSAAQLVAAAAKKGAWLRGEAHEAGMQLSERAELEEVKRREERIVAVQHRANSEGARGHRFCPVALATASRACPSPRRVHGARCVCVCVCVIQARGCCHWRRRRARGCSLRRRRQ